MPGEKEPRGRTRVQIDCSPETIGMIEDLRKRLDLPTRSAVIRRACDVYEYVVEKASLGQDLRLNPEDLRAILGLPQKLEKTRLTKNLPSSSLQKPL